MSATFLCPPPRKPWRAWDEVLQQFVRKTRPTDPMNRFVRVLLDDEVVERELVVCPDCLELQLDLPSVSDEDASADPCFFCGEGGR